MRSNYRDIRGYLGDVLPRPGLAGNYTYCGNGSSNTQPVPVTIVNNMNHTVCFVRDVIARLNFVDYELFFRSMFDHNIRYYNRTCLVEIFVENGLRFVKQR